ncbi:CWF19-like protein 2 isoform X2 [Manihot esculenta]|nr:CWF19-like protein 2 isoform X2 [Manihot esculenta]XP_043810436.1 CWF19-like protein 2 isoform X2 [Manihot esculenta]
MSEKHRRKKKSSSYSSSSDDDVRRIKKGGRKKKKWYSSDENSSPDSSDSHSTDDSSDQFEKKQRNKRKNKRGKHCSSKNDDSNMSKKRSRRGEKNCSVMGYSSSVSEDEGKDGSKRNEERGEKEVVDDFHENVEITRKEMGLDWMLRPADNSDRRPAVNVDNQPEKPHIEEMNRVNPRELNPYLKDNGSGYPDDSEEKVGGGHQLPSSSLVGDGGASWRLKALKRAKEQAAREGRKLEEVVEERWGSLGRLAVSAVSHTAAPARAHLHAIKSRKQGSAEQHQTSADDQSERDVEENAGRDYLKDVSVRHPEMRAPKVRDSLSWGKRKSQKISTKDSGLINAAISSLNKFPDDGSFMSKVLSQQNSDITGSIGSHKNQYECVDAVSELKRPSQDTTAVNETLSANQLAAKALQLRMKGKHEVADKLMQEAENIKVKQGSGENSSGPQKIRNTNRYAVQDVSARRKEDDADRHLAQKIMQNKQYSFSGRADDEYDFEDGPSRKARKKGVVSDPNFKERNVVAKRILTQQERCPFCFENPNRPKHLVVSIANFTYLMLPQWQPVVPGHCCILPMQHEPSTRTVDNNVWEEIRNFKKCLIMMFSQQEKDVVFLETVMGLAQQRRHCLIECVPLPREVAKQAPLYFKKAIDEAEDEWSQHNAKKLIDTSVKGLRGSIPKDFPYFHVEFGLDKGFVHVIDDETQFKNSLGLNVIRGMLRLPEEDMYRCRRHEPVEMQKQSLANFARDWEHFDWTKQLD